MARSPSYGLGQPGPSESIFSVLRDRAREHSLSHLAFEAVLASAIALGVVYQRPYWWVLYLPPAIVACYSVWGLLDRATRATGETSVSPLRARVMHRAILGADWIVLAAGTLGALVLFFLVSGYLLGRWIL